jgi:hypothetical protein
MFGVQKQRLFNRGRRRLHRSGRVGRLQRGFAVLLKSLHEMTDGPRRQAELPGDLGRRCFLFPQQVDAISFQKG